MNFGPISSSFLPIFQKISRLNFIRLHSSGVIQSNMAEARSRDHCAVTSLCAARARLDQWEHSPRWSWPWHQSEARVEACWKCTLGAVPGASPPPPCPRQSTREVLNRVRAWHDRDRDNPASSASWSSKSLGGGMMSPGPWHLPHGSAFILMTHLIPSRQFLLAPSEARCSLCRLYSASYSARAWPGRLTCDFSSLEPTFRSFLKRFSNTQSDEMILIIHPSVGLHEVRNVSVIFYRRQNILLFAKRK